MKKAELIFGAILVPIDYLMLVLAGCSAYFLRFQTSFTQYQPVVYEIPFGEFFIMVLITAFVWLFFFAAASLYNIRGTRRIIEEVRKIFLACSTGVLAIVILFFIERDLFSSRFIILAAYGFSILYVTCARLIILFIGRYLFLKGIGVHHVVLIGATKISGMIASEMKQKKGLGFRIQLQAESLTEPIKKKILALQQSGHADELIQTDPTLSRQQIEEIYEFCDEHHLVFKYAAALFDTQTANIAIQPIAGIPIVEIKKTALDGWGRIAKRLFDIVGAAMLILLTSPLMLLAALTILFDSGRPIFFSRRDNGGKVMRVGQFGKAFRYVKFRTMQPRTDSLRYDKSLQEQDSRKGSPLVKIVNDPRITRVGKLLRRFSIDELPELFLVLKGDMSLVGPRPHLPEEVAQYKKHHKGVLNMKPGITGLAQISGRSDLDFEDEVRLDTLYMEHWALWMDLVILFKTPFVLLKRRKAL